MPQMCQQFWPCSAVPLEWLWLMPIVMPLFAVILVGVPVAAILHHAGRSRWWTVIAFIPLLNLIGLWVFAFSRWPVSWIELGGSDRRQHCSLSHTWPPASRTP